jgi:hypothetical protein
MTATDEAPAQIAPKKTKRDIEFWIAIGAFLVSAVAMITSFLQLSMQRNQERALVWPHVNSRPAYSSEGFSFNATNKGLGPALVRRVEIKVDGKLVNNWNVALDRMLGPGHGYGWDKIKSNDIEDTILAANETATLFSIDWDDRIRSSFNGNNRISVTVCYCSFLEECWLSQSGLDHKAVNQCKNP